MKTRDIMYASIEQNDRVNELMNKPVMALVQRIIELEQENEDLKEYRSRLIKVRNILAEEADKRGKGRPRKDEVI